MRGRLQGRLARIEQHVAERQDQATFRLLNFETGELRLERIHTLSRGVRLSTRVAVAIASLAWSAFLCDSRSRAWSRTA